MSDKRAGKEKRWLYICLALFLLLFFSIILAIKTAVEPPVSLASQTKPADANQPSEQQAQDPNDGKPPRPEHKHPAFRQRIEERARMLTDQIQARDVNDPNVLKAMRIVPRHAFIPASQQGYAYSDQRISS